MKKMTALLIAFCFGLISVAFAHPGGLDSKGGHVEKKTGKWHSHKDGKKGAKKEEKTVKKDKKDKKDSKAKKAKKGKKKAKKGKKKAK